METVGLVFKMAIERANGFSAFSMNIIIKSHKWIFNIPHGFVTVIIFDDIKNHSFFVMISG